MVIQMNMIPLIHCPLALVVLVVLVVLVGLPYLEIIWK
ncbi:putative membrane protein [Escherichia coli 1-176-05_S3_C2]|nr:putative membrane protein [Escherichia coli 1-176-05_S3_C2]